MHNLLQMAEESRAAFEALKQREAPKLAQRFIPRDVDLYWVRLERYFEDIYFPLVQLYGQHPDHQQHVNAIFISLVDVYLARSGIVGAVRNVLADKSSPQFINGRIQLEPYETLWLTGDD